MKYPSRKIVVYVAIATLASACLGFGSWFHDSSSRNANVMFAQQAKFKNGEVLPAGEYRMEVSKDSQTPEVKFYKIYTGTYESQIQVGDKAVASVKATVVTEPTKNRKTEVLSESHGNIQVVKSILPAGWNERLVFSSAGRKSL